MSQIKIEEICDFEGKYLTFDLMEENFGISVQWIMQIIAIPNITKIPKTPPFIKGVINLRGKIVPVMDLRVRFNLPEQEYNDRTSIVVLKLEVSDSDFYIGIIVDKVSEVIDIHKDEIENTPEFGVDFESQFILAMAKIKGKVVTLLDVSRILSIKEMQQIQNQQ